MARFEGTNREFKRYVGAELRVVVQNLTRKHKQAVRACEHCASSENLESAPSAVEIVPISSIFCLVPQTRMEQSRSTSRSSKLRSGRSTNPLRRPC